MLDNPKKDNTTIARTKWLQKKSATFRSGTFLICIYNFFNSNHFF
jgi:hypothetical protein